MMMKGMLKRCLAGVAAAALAVTGMAAMSGAANAALQDAGTITIRNAQPGHTYTAYRIASFDNPADADGNGVIDTVEVSTDETNLEAVKAAAAAANLTVGEPYASDDNPAAWLALNATDSQMREFAEAFETLVYDEESETTVTPTLSHVADVDGDGVIELNLAANGWYVILDEQQNESSAYVSAGTPMVAATIIDGFKQMSGKQDGVTLDLGVVNSKPDTAPQPEKTADEAAKAMGVGEEVHYTITAPVPNFAGMENTRFIVKDTPGIGLKVQADSVKAYVDYTGTEFTTEDGVSVPSQDGKPIEGALDIAADGENPQWIVPIVIGASQIMSVSDDLIPEPSPFVDDFEGDGDDYFTVDMTTWMNDNYSSYQGKNVYVKYTAEITSNVQSAEDVENTPALSHDGKEFTDGDKVIVKVGRFKLHKFGTAETDRNGLAGAEFEVYDADTFKTDDDGSITSDPLVFTDLGGGNYLYAPEDETNTTIVSTTGDVLVNGLPAGDYVVVETKTPTTDYDSNYKAQFTVTVNEDGTWTLKEADNAHGLADQDTKGSLAIQVLNVRSAFELPATGAAGITAFIVLGLLIAGAGVTVYMKSRNVRNAMRA